MLEGTIAVSKASLQELEFRIKRLTLISDKLDILAFEARQASKFLDDVYKSMRLEEE
ncbi:MAG: hypothetical protein KBD90_03305 [Alphaproteobacteria bacterium]|jgi:hypothetical protein|nr:hypothetical protein [Alphaproteobacteria bacterium]